MEQNGIETQIDLLQGPPGVPGTQGARGPKGPEGERGPQGEPQGPSGKLLVYYTVVISDLCGTSNSYLV